MLSDISLEYGRMRTVEYDQFLHDTWVESRYVPGNSSSPIMTQQYTAFITCKIYSRQHFQKYFTRISCDSSAAADLYGISPGGGYSRFFFIGRLGPSIYPSPGKNIRNFKHPEKIFEILATPKNIPHSVH